MSKATTRGFVQHHFLGAKSGAGFTIIELLVVIAIIGLISSVVLVSMRGSTGKAKIAKSLEFSQTILNTTGVDAVGMWSFDEGSGDTAFDKSGYGNHGTLTGGISWIDGEDNTPHWYVNEGQGRSALKTDGDSDYVNVPDSSSLEITKSITVEAWVNGDRWSTNDLMVHKGGAYGLWYDWTGTSADNNEFQFMFHGGGTWRVCDSDFNPKINRWYHIAGSYDYDNNKCHFYVNGNLEKTSTYTQQIDNGSYLRIGGWPSSDRFKGKIDEVRIYASALGSSEIQQHYTDGLSLHQLAINNNK